MMMMTGILKVSADLYVGSEDPWSLHAIRSICIPIAPLLSEVDDAC